MGVIEGGTVAGIVPDERFFAVNYPGYPSSLARATHTLGGEESIAKARSCDGTYLELKFRPEDPYAHAAFGEVHQTSDLLLRIKRRCSRRSSGTRSSTTTNSAAAMVSAGLHTIASSSPDDASRRDSAERNNGAADYEVHADIVARIENTYNFDGMADYQYVLAVHADAAKRSHKRKRDEQRFEKGGLMDMEQEELMMLVPPLFSLKDIPEETVMRLCLFKSHRSYFFHFVHVASIFCNVVLIPLIQVPAPTQWEEKLVQGSVEYQLTAVVAHYFDKQPIWARASLTDCLADQGLTLTTFQIKRLLFRTAFYFGYGPFRTLWIKNGYDPRKDPESRMYQMMDFRIPRAVRENGHAPERPQKDPEWRDICSFRVAPQKKFSHLQLHDLQDDFIQEQIQKPAERSSCSEYTGWFRRATLERIRQHIRVRFLALMPGEVARDFQFNPVEHPFSAMPSPKELAQGDGDSRTVKEHELPGEDDEEDAEVELGKGGEDEEDEEDEEDVEDDEVLIIGDSTDKIPDGFLQELLQRFPFAGSSSPMPGNGQATTTEDVRSEDEYAIYEQDDEDDD
ncbi:unnamed protein product [Sphagnum compactum]